MAASSRSDCKRYRSEQDISSDLAESRATLLELDSAIRVVRQRVFREKAGPKIPGCSVGESALALAVYVLSGCQARVAALFLQTRLPDIPLGDTTRERLVEECFLEANLDDLAGLFNPSTSCQQRLRKKALLFLAEAGVVAWIGEQNLHHGVAPSSLMAAEEYRRLRTAQGDQEEHSPRTRAARKFAVLLRARWHLAFRKLPLRFATFRPEAQLVRVRASDLSF